jgi:tryptophan-rich hypothetical protein
VKQPPRVARLAGTSWTSAAPVEGWRHFHVVGLVRSAAGWKVELAASCDAGRRVLVDARALLDKDGWAPGWVTLQDLEAEGGRKR